MRVVLNSYINNFVKEELLCFKFLTNQTPKMELFVEIVNGLKAFKYFRKKIHFRCLIDPNYAFERTYKQQRFYKSYDFYTKYYYRENYLKFANT